MTAFTPSRLSVLRHAAPAAVLALTTLLGGAALAQGNPAPAPAAPVSPAVQATATPAQPAAVAPAGHGPVLTIRQVYDRLEAAGYRDLREIEWDDYHYEVKGRDAQGARVKLDVDGHTGAVLRSRRR